MIIYYRAFFTHLGKFCLFSNKDGICGLVFPDLASKELLPLSKAHCLNHFRRHLGKFLLKETNRLDPIIIAQIRAYLKGDQRSLSTTLNLIGTPFQKRVWQAIKDIPYGETISYKKLAQVVNCKGYRAVARACSANPMPLFIPCHRVVGERGVGGFYPGLDWKLFLLRLENLDIPQNFT